MTAAAGPPLRARANAPRGTLEIVDVSLSYRGVKAVSNVSLTVKPGELVGLIGPNGAGKTSLIDAITGYAPAAKGDVRLDGRSLGHKRPHLRARAGLIRTFQNLEIFDDLTVAENIEVGVRATRRSSRARHQGLPFGLDAERERVAGALSQGHRRMLALARAIACDPEVLVLDEPAAGLDTNESKDLGTALRHYVDDGLGI